MLRRLRERGDHTPVIVITGAPRVGLNELVSEAGGQGVVLKRSEPAELLAALRRVVRGESVLEPGHPRRPAGQAALSPRERDVLHAVAAGATNAEVAAQLGVSRESVKTLLRRSFAKLGVDNRLSAVEAARSRGLL